VNYQPEGNYFDKYNSSNPIVQKLMRGFFTSIENILYGIDYQNVLEAGCGEGRIADFLYRNRQDIQLDAFDISEKVIEQAKKNYPYIHFSTGSIYDIRSPDGSYDLVVASEVLEHLENPEKAMKELLRVSKRYVLATVPHEPIWRILNLCRGKYWRYMGNTPGHIQHWGIRSFNKVWEKILSHSGGCAIKHEYPLPWIVVLFEKSNTTGA